MTILVFALLVVYSAVATVVAMLSMQRNLQLTDKLEELDEEIIKASKVLYETQEVFEQKSKIEVFSDEPVVRDLLQSVTNAKDAVKSVARLLDSIAVNEGDEEESVES